MNTLHLKHWLVTSFAAGPLKAARRAAKNSWRNLRHPELGLLHQEDQMMDAVIRRLLQPTSVCIDVGAHIGSMTHLFRQLAPEGAHVAVEAEPVKAAWLRKAFPDLTIAETAVSDSEGEVTFYENLDRPGFSSLSARAGRVQEITVPCTTLDKLLAERDRVDLMKIDVEGFELNVIRGAREVIARLKPILIFEAGAANDPDIDDGNYITLLDFLNDELGYEVRPVFGEFYGKAPIGKAEFLACRTYPFFAFNYVARPKS